MVNLVGSPARNLSEVGSRLFQANDFRTEKVPRFDVPVNVVPRAEEWTGRLALRDGSQEARRQPRAVPAAPGKPVRRALGRVMRPDLSQRELAPGRETLLIELPPRPSVVRETADPGATAPGIVQEMRYLVLHEGDCGRGVGPTHFRGVPDIKENRRMTAKSGSPARSATEAHMDHERDGEVQSKRIPRATDGHRDGAKEAGSDLPHPGKSRIKHREDSSPSDRAPVDTGLPVVSDLFPVELGPPSKIVSPPRIDGPIGRQGPGPPPELVERGEGVDNRLAYHRRRSSRDRGSCACGLCWHSGKDSLCNLRLRPAGCAPLKLRLGHPEARRIGLPSSNTSRSIFGGCSSRPARGVASSTGR